MYTNRNRCKCIRTLNASAQIPSGSIAAGEGCMSECAKTGLVCGLSPALAQVESPIQEYRTGFCPCKALQQGTYFPELVK